jgi:hypothetical protein
MLRAIRGKVSATCLRVLAVYGVLALGLFLQACSDFTSSGRPKNARYLLEGPASAAMTLRTSQNFFVSEDGGLDFQSLDERSVTVPLEETVSLGAPARFYISAANGEEEAQTFTMRVWIGGESWYNETRILEPGDDFEFVYRYNEPGIY